MEQETPGGLPIEQLSMDQLFACHADARLRIKKLHEWQALLHQEITKREHAAHDEQMKHVDKSKLQTVKLRG